MKERPILFKPELVRAILDGRKTQTRRVVKIRSDARRHVVGPTWILSECPYGVVGDRLWVRERWAISGKKFRADGSDDVKYKSSWAGDPPGGRWRPSIHMPRAACRLFLEITEVRVQKLHDIMLLEEDAVAEGCHADPRFIQDTARDKFKQLWININGLDSWMDNPWVWALTFKML